MRHISLGVVIAALMALALAPAAAARPPEHFSFPSEAQFPIDIGCGFPVDFSSLQRWEGINRFDSQDNPLGAEAWARGQDTFSANGKALVGLPYTFHVSVMADASGFSKYTSAGVIERIRLPDGSMLVAAGWFTFLDKDPNGFYFNPDRGSQLDVAALCAALAP